MTVSTSYTPALASYTVSYNANGGTGTMSNSTAIYNTSFKTKQNAFTKTGYKFNGWNEKPDGTGVSWSLTSPGTYESGTYWTWTYTYNITLYAQWTPNQYTITVDPNGGSFSNAETTPVTLSPNLIYNAQNWWNLGSYLPTKLGYEFIGFYTSASGENKVYDANGQCVKGTYWNQDGNGAVYSYTGNLTVYAHWKPLNIAYYKLNGKWTLCNSYIKDNNIWKPAIMKQKNGDNYV